MFPGFCPGGCDGICNGGNVIGVVVEPGEGPTLVPFGVGGTSGTGDACGLLGCEGGAFGNGAKREGSVVLLPLGTRCLPEPGSAGGSHGCDGASIVVSGIPMSSMSMSSGSAGKGTRFHPGGGPGGGTPG